MGKIDELEQMVKRLEPTNGPTVLVDVTFLELKQLLAVVRAAQECDRLLNDWDLIRQHSYAHESLSKALAELDK